MDTNTITYSTQIVDSKHSDWRKTITHEDVDNYDFEHNNFIEIVDKAEYIRLYFDFDSIETTDDYDNVIEWLDNLKDTFGEYAIGGYTRIQAFTQYGFKLIKDAHHILSFHVVFYESMIKSSWLIEIMRCKNKQYIHTNINKFCDPNVYKLETRQLMRHPLSNKYYKKNYKDNTITAGSLLNYTKPSNLIITPIGTEDIVEAADLIKLFDLPSNFGNIDKIAGYKISIENDDDYDDYDEEEDIIKPVAKKPIEQTIKRSHHKKPITINDIEYNDKLILFDKAELIEFLDNFDNCCNTILTTLAPLYHSPYSKEYLIDAVSEWYEQVEHNHPENVENFINRYYEYDDSNKWFYSLLKHLPKEKSDVYKAKYCDSLDFSININNSKITYEDVKAKRYEIERPLRLLNVLRAVLGVIDDVWYLKILKDNQPFIITLNEDKLMKKLKTFKPFKNNNSINLYQFVSKFSNVFHYKAAEMSKDYKDNIINLFQGFKYQEIITDDFTLIQPFLNHIRKFICKDNEEKYTYFMSWFANIFQNITVKNSSVPIIHGAQGSGKSFPTEVFADLLGNYALANVDDLDKVFGKFNGLVGQSLLVVINEPPESNEKFKFTGKIKSKTTQKRTIQETKGVDQVDIISWANYMMTTNNPNPIQAEKGDRRYIYYETDNSMCGNEQYFKDLCKPIQQTKQGEYNKEFMGILLHYMRTQIDVSDFDGERLIRKINSNTQTDYNEQLERQYLDLNNVEKYVVENYELFEKGLTSYNIEHITIEGYSAAGIKRKLNAICDVKIQQHKEGKKVNKSRLYTLKPKEQIPDLYNIIEYRHFGEEDTNDINNDITSNEEL